MAIQQSKRQVRAKSPLGKDVLVFRSMNGTDGLSQLFRYEVELLSEKLDVSGDEVLGTEMTIELDIPGGSTRYFNGYVTRFSYVGRRNRLAVFRAVLRPWFWFLTRTSDCKIYQEMTVVEIIEKVFRDENGFSDFKLALNETYPVCEYCVQYRETDFNFVSRLMEQVGIYYYFEHEDGKHTMVLSDSYSSHKRANNYDKIPYFPPDAQNRRERDHIFEWSAQKSVESGVYALNDFDFTAPKKDLNVETSMPNSHQFADYEIYDYPGEYAETSDGQTFSKVRLEELQAGYSTVAGEADARGLVSGNLFELTGYPRKAENKEYLITSVTHTVQSDDYYSGSGGGEPYRCRFTAIDSAIAFRPPRITPKPVVQGPQTAVVVGKSGEEIWTDEHGRVKVQFHWDRYGKKDENSSCWVRVAQIWAGKQWGAIFIPRIEQEVIVEFLEGDPDRPIITGRVYNGDNKAPYALPDNGTQSGIKSRSSKEGGTADFNELRFEDNKGKEHVYFHAQKDFERFVENDDKLTVEHDQTIEITNDRTEKVKDGNETVTIEKGNRTVTISKGNEDLKVDTGNRTVTVGKGNDTLTVKMGNQTTKVSMGKSSHEAMQSIELKVGSNSIKIDQMGITIKGMMIKLQGSTITEVKGSAMVKVQGGMVMIN